jgi:anti-sigma B factor antagonist
VSEIPFEIRLRESNDTTIALAVTGDLDIATSPALRAAVHDHIGQSVVIDLAEVGFIDSTALGVLVAARERATNAGGKLIVENVQDAPRRVLEMTGLYGLLVGDNEEG